jgi:hypothetical protein
MKLHLPASDYRLDMGFSKSSAVFGALVLISCGSPAELDENDFPSINEAGYNSTGSGGSGTNVVSGGAGSGSLGNAGSMGSAGASGMMAGGGCPSDITVLFARPIAQGGCTQGGGCPEASSQIKPDLVSPGVVSRLLNVPSMCSRTSNGMSVAPRPYIGATDSFLEEKIAGSPDASCGYAMPFFMENALSAADEQCIIDWIDQVAAGGG